MNRYLLAIKLNYNFFPGRSEIHIPFYANNNSEAETKADSIISIWQDGVLKAELFELDSIQTWSNK